MNDFGLPANQPASPPPAAEVVFVYRGERRALAPQIDQGTAPDDFLYGYPEVRKAFNATDFIEADTSGMAVRRVMKPFEMFTAYLGFGLFYSTIVLNWKTVKRARVIVATTDSTGIPLLILKRLGFLRAHVVVISQGLHSLGKNAAHLPWAGWLQDALGGLLANAAAIIVLGDGDKVAIRQAFAHRPLPEVVTNQFGVDHRFWRPAETDGAVSAGDGFVLSVGSDGLRDYPTLVAAIGSIPLRLVTRLPLPPEAARENIQVLGKLEWPALRSLYQRSRFVVTPVKNQPRDSGHSATLQAMACGKAVILSDTAGLWDRENMRHDDTCILVKSGDAAAMRVAISDLWAKPEKAARIGGNARELVAKKYSSAQFGARMTEIVRRLIDPPLQQEP